MKLRELNARFVRVRQEPVDPTIFVDGVLSPDGIRTYIDRVEFAEAQGLWFDCPCPKCQAGIGGPVLIGFAGRGAPPKTLSIGSDGSDTQWNIVGGSSLDDLQLAPSIQIHGGCDWHGFVGSNGVPAGEAA